MPVSYTHLDVYKRQELALHHYAQPIAVITMHIVCIPIKPHIATHRPPTIIMIIGGSGLYAAYSSSVSSSVPLLELIEGDV